MIPTAIIIIRIKRKTEAIEPPINIAFILIGPKPLKLNNDENLPFPFALLPNIELKIPPLLLVTLSSVESLTFPKLLLVF